ncbi:hypothetical protein PF005_g4495 [Phytophthora fragariae]|uniref:Uncharacterized protein n=1 Tax=Phytophthora fragariae TaxID=53985 RepID=A0A6A3Z0C8_9STRA|nr:hypothetical protein PF009_g4905 [Phytophthora fragariae]KAE9024143.1 hypothetical protein PF011_g3638 [Phytophthora fragariae]KAE9130246.1 hypothetical protein PF007_g4571 [Phytophthora fragariae]KAE9130282.1 hypothetical protein PF010_g3885 [Phytophthora fragariae]KAE9151890.1 hypothetical protein PF006_g3833 [Phytophthora fragariae]
MSERNSRRGQGREVTLPYEQAYPWEDERGCTVDRTVEVNAEAKRVYAMQEQLLPTLALDRPLDPVASEHLQDVGRRVLILRDTTKRSRKKTEAGQSPKQSPKRVIPSRFPEITPDFDEEDRGEPDRVEEEEDPVVTDGRIAAMLMDQEWDTRAWNATKIQTAVDTLYEEIEHCEEDSRRDLATKMLLRLMEKHEDAVDYVETSLPSLTNKAFRTLSKLTNNTKIFRMARLVAVLAEWFAHVLSSENAAIKSIGCLLRETELCARILQHHWRGVLFERTVSQRDYDPIVRTRLRSMHMIKFVELRDQFKVYREAVGPGGIPSNVTQAYITILYHLVKLQRDADCILSKTRSTVLSDQRRVLGSGLLVCLASLITRHQSREVIELVKGIVVNIVEGHGEEQIVEILQSNVVQRVQLDLTGVMETSNNGTTAASIAALTSSLNLLLSISNKVLLATEQCGHKCTASNIPTSPLRRSPTKDHARAATPEERNFLIRILKASIRQFLLTADVFDTLFEVLCYCRDKDDILRAQVLEILCLLARSLGFSQLLDALTRCGGRWLEQVLLCMKDSNLVVVQAAVTLFYEMTSRTDARHGLTTAGAVQILLRWCPPSFDASESRMTFIMGLIGCALLARQTEQAKPVTALLEALATFDDRLDALYTLLLELALQEDSSPRASEKTAAYFFSVNALPTIVQFLTQVSPSCMESPVQNSRQRNISCILLGPMCKVTHVSRACFSENIINHLALSIQCNRLDEIEGLVARSSSEDRFIHQLGSKEACKALSRLTRCPSNMVDARLRPSITSSQVPEWPQALICDVMFRMHVLEDLIALIRKPSDAAEFAEVELSKTIAAVELAGYIRPLPYGESSRDKFLKTHANHPHGKYAQVKLLQLVELVAPAILHILREKSISFDLVSACCVALSRLACTNSACSLLLTQGCLQTALIHLPEVLISTTTAKSSPKKRSVEFDTSVDDHGLLDVPAALYTLFGKLCAVADGRTGIMRAQVLPRLLKRMQLRHPTSRTLDDECKSEIAVVISHLAMVNAVEGSTSELFLHFRVLELLTKVLQQHKDLVLAVGTVSSSAKKKDEVKRWRLLVHAVSAIAALSQDVLVCVPRVVALGIVELLFPFLARLRLDGNSNPHLASLQYAAVTIIRSIASYPFGEYHAYLSNVRGSAPDRASAEKKSKSGKGDKTPMATPTLVMERVKQIGYDFAMELQNKPMALRDKKSVGELARETMAFINEHNQRQQRQQEQRRKSSVSNTAGVTGVLSHRSSVKPQTCASFPTLPQSPVRRSDELTGDRSKTGKKSRDDSSAATSETTPIVTPSILVLDGGSKSPVSLNGVNISSTRPAGNKTGPSSESPHAHHRYVFTRSKPKPKRRNQDPAYNLMLDPLFDSISGPMNSRKLPASKAADDSQHPNEEVCDYKFSQEVDRFGHYVNVQARRDKKGDRYFPSLGRIVTTDRNL